MARGNRSRKDWNKGKNSRRSNRKKNYNFSARADSIVVPVVKGTRVSVKVEPQWKAKRSRRWHKHKQNTWSGWTQNGHGWGHSLTSMTFRSGSSRPTTSSSSSSTESAMESKYMVLGLWISLGKGRKKQISATQDTGGKGANMISDKILRHLGIVKWYPLSHSQDPIVAAGGRPVTPVGTVRLNVKTECMPDWKEVDFNVVRWQEIPNRDNALLCRELSFRIGHFREAYCPKCQD